MKKARRKLYGGILVLLGGIIATIGGTGIIYYYNELSILTLKHPKPMFSVQLALFGFVLMFWGQWIREPSKKERDGDE